MGNHGDPACGIVPIFPVSFVWEVIGFSCFSLQTGSAFVPILSGTEIVVEAMYRVLVGGCRVALVRSGGVCPMLNTATSSSSHQIGHKAQLSPAATTAATQEKSRWERAKCCTVSEEWGEGVKSSPADTRVRRGDVPGVQTEVLSAGDHSGADTHTAAHGKDHTLASTYPWRSHGPWRAHAGAGLSWSAVAHGKEPPHRRGQECKEEMLRTYHSPHSLHCLEVRKEKVKLSMSKGGTSSSVFSFC